VLNEVGQACSEPFCFVNTAGAAPELNAGYGGAVVLEDKDFESIIEGLYGRSGRAGSSGPGLREVMHL